MKHDELVRVASAPHGHVYVQHLSDPDDTDGVVRLDDPVPENPAIGAPWWPLVMLDVAWIGDHADEFDLYHLHFGFDALEPDELQRIADSLHQRGKPLVYTVHDLRNPHHHDRRAHDAALDVLIRAADELITLTTGAATEIEQRWGRKAQVVAHPHVVELADLGRARPRHDRPTVGIHLKSMRANLDPLPVLDVLLTEAPARGIDVLIDVHTDVVTPGAHNHHPEVVDQLDRAAKLPGVRVQVHDFYSDEELWDYFTSLDMSVLPYRFGTHSGWLEACYDLGTHVLAPRIGYYHDQQDGVLGYRLQPNGQPNRSDIVAALDALPALAAWQADPGWRTTQRREVAARHAEIYCAALARLRS